MLINSLTGRNNKTNNITEISVNNPSINDTKLIAEAFNEYFINVGLKLASEVNCELLEEEMNNVYIPNPQLRWLPTVTMLMRTVVHYGPLILGFIRYDNETLQ